jgi:hypothetical protein
MTIKKEIINELPLCACGCGERIKTSNRLAKYINGHREYLKITLTYEHLSDKVIVDAAREHFMSRIVDAGYLSMNKKIRSNCVTTKPHRGPEQRIFIDRYIRISFSNPYNVLERFETHIHRLAALLYIGDIPDGYIAAHKCDIKMCCNPHHIYIGTQKDNLVDHSNRRGTYGPNKHLTRHCIESIKYYLDLGQHTRKEIADGHDCSRSTVNNVALGNNKITTDGSEVIGDIFIPRIIPKSNRKRFRNL